MCQRLLTKVALWRKGPACGPSRLIQWVIPPIPSNQATHGEYWKLKRNTRVFNIVFNSKGKMNNDPADNIMRRSDFSLPIISFIWIAAAGPALHFIVWGAEWGGLNSIACVCQNLIYVLMTDTIFMKRSRSHTHRNFYSNLQLLLILNVFLHD